MYKIIKSVLVTFLILNLAFSPTAIAHEGTSSMSSSPTASSTPGGGLSDDDRNYLLSVYEDTWNYLSTFVAPSTGFPYDSNRKQPATSISNVGLYMGAAAIAFRTGLISREEAVSRIQKALESLTHVETWKGFPRVWVTAKSLKAITGTEEFSYSKHTSNLIAGLILARNTFTAELGSSINAYLSTLDFQSMYDAGTGWLKGGYDVTKNNYAIGQPWGNWYYKYLASEARLTSFYLMAVGAAPASSWDAMIRPVQKQGDQLFLVPGYEDGGAYMPYMASLYIDERNTLMGASQSSYSLAQILHAKDLGAPVWGWSAGLDTQSEYIAYGELRDEIVAPYASMLALIHYPQQVVENLKTLEALGVRPDIPIRGSDSSLVSFIPDGPEWDPTAFVGHDEVYFRNQRGEFERLSPYFNQVYDERDENHYDLEVLERLLNAAGQTGAGESGIDSNIAQIILATEVKPSLDEQLSNPSDLIELVRLASRSHLYYPARIKFKEGAAVSAAFLEKGSWLTPEAIARNGEVFFTNRFGEIESLKNHIESLKWGQSINNYHDEELTQLANALGIRDSVHSVTLGAQLNQSLKNLALNPSQLYKTVSLATHQNLYSLSTVRFGNGEEALVAFVKEGSFYKPWAMAARGKVYFVNHLGELENLEESLRGQVLSTEEEVAGANLSALKAFGKYFGDSSFGDDEVKDSIEEVKTLSDDFIEEIGDPLKLADLALLAEKELGIDFSDSFQLSSGEVVPASFSVTGKSLSPWAISTRRDIYFLNANDEIEKLSDYIDNSDNGRNVEVYDLAKMGEISEIIGHSLSPDQSVDDLIKDMKLGSRVSDDLKNVLIDPSLEKDLIGLAGRASFFHPNKVQFKEPAITNYGFRDSIDWTSGTVTRDYLTPSQGMSFLSLANVIFDGIVWESFAEDPKVAGALPIIQKDTLEDFSNSYQDLEGCFCSIA